MRSSRRCLSTTAAVAEALLGAWKTRPSTGALTRAGVGGVRELRDVFAVHEASRRRVAQNRSAASEGARARRARWRRARWC